MLHKIKKISAVLLAFLMVFQVLEPGLQVLAFDMDTDAEIYADAEAEDVLWPDEIADMPAPNEAEEGSTELTGDDVIGELVHLRESNVKHFRMSDGSIIAVMYTSDVHFEDADGNWVDIDNSLTLDTVEDIPVTAETERLLDTLEELLEDAEGAVVREIEAILADSPVGVEDIVITTEDALLDVHFNLESGCDETPDFVVEHEGYTVGMSLIGAEERVAEVIPAEVDPYDNSLAAALQIPSLTSRIIYRDILPSVDLEFVLHGNEVKENIIVHERLESHTFFFELDLAGLRPVPNEDGSISLVSRDTGEDVLLIPAPFMWDADGTFSTAVRYEIVPAGAFRGEGFIPALAIEGEAEAFAYLPEEADAASAYTALEADAIVLSSYQEEIEPSDFPEIEAWDYENADEDDRYLFVVIVDEEWMHDAERAFPVTIDPPIIIQRRQGNLSTGFVRSNRPTVATGESENLFFGYSGGSGNAGWGFMYLRVNALPSLPNNSIVIHAGVHMLQIETIWGGWSSVGKSSMRVPVYAMTSGPLRSTNSQYYESTTGAWLRSLRWNTRPTHGSIMLDYTTISDAPRGRWVDWTITGITREWYAGRPNFGLAFVPLDNNPANQTASPPAGRRANATFANYWAVERPIFVVNYRNTAGIVGHHTYATQSLGRAGTGHVGDFMGQLTVVNPIVGNASATMPFSLAMVYNSAWANRHFTQYNETQRSGATINTRVFNHMRFGYGWKPSVLETIVERRLPSLEAGRYTTFLVHLNASGTEHYFSQNNDSGDTYYRDEDGLGLRIRRDTATNTFYMYDDLDNRKIFRHGILSEIIDRNGNQMRFIYNDRDADPSGPGWHPHDRVNNRLLQVRQRNYGAAEITVARLYYLDDRLIAIYDRAGNATRFTHANGHLTRVWHPDGTSVRYTYSEDGRMTMAHDEESGLRVAYGWDYTGQVNAINTFGANADGTNRYEAVHRVWRNSRTDGFTRIWDLGPDVREDTEDDILEYIIFDNLGRTVNYYITDYTHRNILAASTSRYTRNHGTDRRNNRVTETASIGMAAVNLLRNSGLEDAAMAHWGTWGAGVWIAGVDSSHARTGMQSMEFRGPNDGGAHQTVRLEANTTYTFSAYVNTNEVTQFRPNANGDSGPILNFSYNDSTVARTARFDIVTSQDVNDGWHRISVTYTTGHTPRQYVVGILFLGITGTVRADDFQLEAGEAPSNANLVQNGSFETDDHWDFIRTNADTVSIRTEEQLSGTRSLRMLGHPERRESAVQYIPIHLPITETFVLSGWAKANALPSREDEREPGFGILAQITYSDGETEDHFMTFNPDIRAGDGLVGWQFASMPIVPKIENPPPELMIRSIQVQPLYERNGNTAFFDNISLVREAAQTFKYDTEGNLVRVGTTALDDTVKEHHEGNNLLKRLVTPGSGTFTYEYDAAHNLTRVTNNELITDLYYHSARGNNERTVLRNKYGGSQLVSTAEFSADGHLLTARRDTNGTVQRFNYGNNVNHEMRGIPAEVTTGDAADGRQIVTRSGFDALSGRRTVMYQPGLASVRYAHEDGLLTQITRTGFQTPGNTDVSNRMYQTYHFAHNALGQTTEISLGNLFARHTLMTYEYDNYNRLTSRQYANGDTVSYEYDVRGRLSAVTHSDGAGARHARFVYTYTGDGRLHSAREYFYDANGSPALRRVYEFNYDTLGRPVGIIERDGSGRVLQHGHSQFDHAGRVSSFAYQIPSIGANRRTDFAFDSENGNLTRLALPSGANRALVYEYDHLRRIQTRRLTGGVRWETDFTYGLRLADENETSLQVATMTHQIGNQTLRFAYQYDNLGQITRWVDPVSQFNHHYTYDAQNQLTREVLYTAGLGTMHQFDYTYDTFGNIQTRTHRRPGRPTQTTTFSYDYALWRDLLTAVDGNPITYDPSGNPTRWHDGTEFTWARGRQMQSARTPDGTHITMTYDADGIRTSKRVETERGTTYHTYYTQGGRIVAETRRMYGFVNGAWRNGHTTTLEFIYDESGRPVQLIWNDGHSAYQQVFNYVLNLQGDVVQLRQASDGAVVATYLYNAWGEILSSSGWMAGHNPLRYRGKYYDSALGMYYLQSRYYDPGIGRFINGDAFVSTGQGLLGYNMFAFCLNNPVMLSDHTGYWGCSSLLTICATQMTPTQQKHQAAAHQARANLANEADAIRRATARKRVTAQLALQMGNTNPQAAIYALEFYSRAWYRHTPVRQQSTFRGSFAIAGTIWINSNLAGRSGMGWLVQHEWGHIVQERMIQVAAGNPVTGTVVYFVTIGIPSIISSRASGLEHNSMPWETSADWLSNFFGGRWSPPPPRPSWDWQGTGCR